MGNRNAKMVFGSKACEAEVKYMGTTIKARYAGGVLEPLEKLELTEGQEVTVTIFSLPLKIGADFLTRTAGGWAGLIDAERLKREVNASRLVTTRPEPRL
jgi:predicted DNA-binding antitoxin AbrB/MazE fold protein